MPGKHEVAAVSIWMGMLKTDRTRRVMDADAAKYAGFWDMAENPEFTGHLISEIYRDPKRMEKSGQVIIGAELALDYGLKDIDGKQPPSHRPMLGGPTLSAPRPSSVRHVRPPVAAFVPHTQLRAVVGGEDWLELDGKVAIITGGARGMGRSDFAAVRGGGCQGGCSSPTCWTRKARNWRRS